MKCRRFLVARFSTYLALSVSMCVCVCGVLVEMEFCRCCGRRGRCRGQELYSDATKEKKRTGEHRNNNNKAHLSRDAVAESFLLVVISFMHHHLRRHFRFPHCAPFHSCLQDEWHCYLPVYEPSRVSFFFLCAVLVFFQRCRQRKVQRAK